MADISLYTSDQTKDQTCVSNKAFWAWVLYKSFVKVISEKEIQKIWNFVQSDIQIGPMIFYYLLLLLLLKNPIKDGPLIFKMEYPEQ